MKKLAILSRLIYINFLILTHYFKGYNKFLTLDYYSDYELSKDQIKSLIAEITVGLIEKLGPTFIKFGQVLSSRPDLIPQFFIEKLNKLQDEVPGFEYDEVEKIFKSEFKKTPDQIFDKFEKKPIASASVAQVHKAFYKEDKVAIKIRRPDVKKNIQFDITILLNFAKYIQYIFPTTKLFNLTNIVHELEKALLTQLDFNIELQSLVKFNKNFKNDSYVKFPKPYPKLSSKKIIVMEFLDGKKPTEYQKFDIDPLYIAKKGIDISLKMIYRDGFFHADPHPGNIFIFPSQKDKLGIIDCGVVGSVSKEEKYNTLNFILGVVQDEPSRVAEAIFKACGGVSKNRYFDYNKYLKDVENIFYNFVGKKLSELEFSVIISKVYKLVAKHKITVASNYTMIFVALITIEGVAKTLAPELDLIEEARPYSFEILSALNN